MEEKEKKFTFIEVMWITLRTHEQMEALGLRKDQKEAVCRVLGILSPDGKMPDKSQPLDVRDHWQYNRFLHKWRERQEEEKKAKKE